MFERLKTWLFGKPAAKPEPEAKQLEPRDLYDGAYATPVRRRFNESYGKIQPQRVGKSSQSKTSDNGSDFLNPLNPIGINSPIYQNNYDISPSYDSGSCSSDSSSSYSSSSDSSSSCSSSD